MRANEGTRSDAATAAPSAGDPQAADLRQHDGDLCRIRRSRRLGLGIQANSVGPRELKNNAVRAKHIKKNHVKAKHVAKNTVRTPKIRNGAVNNAKLHSNLRARWARFGGGSAQPAFQGRGVLDVTRLSAGRYDVTFNRDPRDCAMFASLSPFTLDGRFIGVGPSDTGGPNDVRVQTRNGNGDLADAGGIHVLLVC